MKDENVLNFSLMWSAGLQITQFEPFCHLQEVENLVNASCVTERITLAIWQANLQKYWNSSPYYLAEESDILKSKDSNF